MRIEASKWDLRKVLNSIAAVLVVGLTVAVIGITWSLLMAGYFVLLGGMGFALARLLGARGEQTPVPRGLRQRWMRGSFRRAAADQPFNTRIGWTSGSEPGGSLPDARRVTPYGLTGGGLYTDGIVALLVGLAILALMFTVQPLNAFIVILHFSVFASVCYGAVVLVRWLRHR